MLLMAQDIASLQPSSGNAGQTLNVLITGSNTNFSQASNTIIFYFNSTSGNYTNPNYITVNSNTSITANITIPAGTYTGLHNMALYNSIDGLIEKPSSFYVNGISQPEISSISPAQGNAGQTLNVTIYGNNTNFAQASNTVAFYFNSASPTVTYPNYFSVINNTTLSANLTIPANTYTGVYDFSVYNFIDGFMLKPQSFTVNGLLPPSIVSLSPNTGFAGQTLNVVISGSNTTFAQASNTIGFIFNTASQTITYPNHFNVNSNTSITANITIPPQTAPGSYEMFVANPFNGYLFYQPFYVTSTSPQIVNVTPSSAKQGQSLEIIFDVAGSVYSQGSGNQVELKKGPNSVLVPSSINVLNSYKIVAFFDVPWNAETGLYDVVLKNNLNETLVANEAFEVELGNSVALLDNKNHNFRIYPNPFINSFTLEYSIQNNVEAEIELIDFTGKSITIRKSRLLTGKNAIQLEPPLEPGIYFIRVKSGQGVMFQSRIVKQ